MADDIVSQALGRGYSLDDIAGKLSADAGMNAAEIRARGYSSADIIGKLGYAVPEAPKGAWDTIKDTASSIGNAANSATDFLAGAAQKTAQDLGVIKTPSVMGNFQAPAVNPLAEGAGPRTVESYNALKAAAKNVPLNAPLDLREADNRVIAHEVQKRVQNAQQITGNTLESPEQMGERLGASVITSPEMTAYNPDTSPVTSQVALGALGAPDWLKRGAGDIESGAAVGIAGSALSFAGRKLGNDDLSRLGQSMSNYAARGVPANPNMVDSLVSGAASLATFYVAGLGVMTGVKAVGTVFPALATTASAAGSSAMTALMAATAADHTYKEGIARGLSPDLAAKDADKSFLLNAGLMGIGNKIAFFTQFKSTAATAVAASASFSAQNAGMTQISNELAGRDRFEGVPQSMLEGAILGPLMHIPAIAHEVNLRVGSKERQLGLAIQEEVTNNNFNTEQAALGAMGRPVVGVPPTLRERLVANELKAKSDTDKIENAETIDKAIEAHKEATAAAPSITPTGPVETPGAVAKLFTDIRKLPEKPEAPAIQTEWQDSPETAITKPGWGTVTATRGAVGAHDHPENLAANEQLAQELKDRGIPYDYLPKSGFEGEEQGASFRVYADEATINGLTEKYQQDSSMTNRGYINARGEVVAPIVHTNNVFGPEALKAKSYSVDEQGNAFSAGITSHENIQNEKFLVNALRNNDEVKLDENGAPSFEGIPFKMKTADDLPVHDDPNRVGLSKEGAQVITAGMKKLGLTAVFFEHHSYDDGFFSPWTDGRVYINTASSKAADVIAYHEAYHALPEEAKTAVKKVIEDGMTPEGWKEAEKQHKISPETEKGRNALLEEIAADIFGNAQRRPEFMKTVTDHLIAEHGTTRARQIMQSMLDSLANVVKQLRELFTGAEFQTTAHQDVARVYVKNLEAVHDELAKVMAKRLGDTAMQKELAKLQERQNAKQEPSTSEPNGGGGAQPRIREEGRNPSAGGEGLQRGGQREGNDRTRQLSEIEVDVKTINVENGKTIVTKEKADVALKELDDQITLAERLKECLGS